MRALNFETAIEKLGRILASQYNINVRFEGNQAYTDGKEIVLPFIQNMSKELYDDLNGYLDHEVAHCKFTDFPQITKVINRMHKELLNAVEDVRIENLMKEEFPGTAFNLEPLNEKLRSRIAERWDELPFPVRTIMAIRDIMEGRAPRIDEDIERYVDVVKDAAIELRKCKSTEELRVLTEEIIKRIIDEREEEKREESEGDEGEESSGDKDSEGKGSGSKGKSDPEGDKSKGDKSKGDSEDSTADDMLTDGASEESAWDDYETSVHDLVDEKIEEELADSKKGGRVRPDKHEPAAPVWNDSPSIPVTTKYDAETDHSAKGNSSAYAALKREIMPLVMPIKAQLERVLKVQENAKWRVERERGMLDSRSLSKLSSQPGYRTPFKDFTKTQTNNVAVQILVDMSGSMGGRMRTAKMATIAMGEALKDLGISFEVTGFYSTPDSRVATIARSLEDRSRFNRMTERLELHIFKSFDTHSLTGIEKMFVGAQNPDGECVIWAAKRLAERKEKRKILLVLSDGEPATGDSNRGILCSDLKNKVKAIQKSGIECIGIGIETDCVKHYYPDFVVLNNVTDLPKKAMKKLSSLITRGATR